MRYLIRLTEVKVKKNHPYTLCFKVYVPHLSNNKIYNFEFDSELKTSAYLPESVLEDLSQQLGDYFGSGKKYDQKKAREQLKNKGDFTAEINE